MSPFWMVHYCHSSMEEWCWEDRGREVEEGASEPGPLSTPASQVCVILSCGEPLTGTGLWLDSLPTTGLYRSGSFLTTFMLFSGRAWRKFCSWQVETVGLSQPLHPGRPGVTSALCSMYARSPVPLQICCCSGIRRKGGGVLCSPVP